MMDRALLNSLVATAVLGVENAIAEAEADQDVDAEEVRAAIAEALTRPRARMSRTPISVIVKKVPHDTGEHDVVVRAAQGLDP